MTERIRRLVLLPLLTAFGGLPPSAGAAQAPPFAWELTREEFWEVRGVAAGPSGQVAVIGSASPSAFEGVAPAGDMFELRAVGYVPAGNSLWATQLPTPPGFTDNMTCITACGDGFAVAGTRNEPGLDPVLYVARFGSPATSAPRLPESASLLEVSASPNLFQASTVILFRTLRSGRSALRIYDVGGRLVRVLDEAFGPGPHSLQWDGDDAEGRPVAAGVYLVRAEVAGQVGVSRVQRLR